MATYDVAVIGGGPGGYVAAIRASQLGLKTVCIEREALVGVCLNWGCIPSKSLIHTAEVLNTINNAESYGISVGEVSADFNVALERSRKVVDRLTRGVAALFKKHGVEHIAGHARLEGPRSIAVGDERIEANNVIIATGGRPRPLPGIEVDGDTVVTYREAILQGTAPSNVVVIGGGAIGVEFGFIYNAYGAKVTLVEALPRVLPNEDPESSAVLVRSFRKRGMEVFVDSKVKQVEKTSSGVIVHVETPDDDDMCVSADRVLICTGILANTEDLGLEIAGVELEKGFIKVDGDMRTNVDGVFAIGDVTGKMPLAHVAQAQAVLVAERVAGQETKPIDYLSVPRATYANPQVASMGLTEAEAVEQGYEVKIGKFPFLANGKALSLDDYEGFAKVVVDESTGEVLGAHLVGHDVTELLGELSLARLLEGTNVEVGAVINAHPTLSEAIKEAALAADGRAVHI
ncbi:MAG: dihydrolipoyl dehydrogenase [Chloroflexi bacterium]|nr:dihydrolipoyl dehydrogenase [Chloroflexota bacterium]